MKKKKKIHISCSTGYSSWRDHMKKIFGPEVIDSLKDMWGLDEEDEMIGAYRPTGHPGVILFYFI